MAIKSRIDSPMQKLVETSFGLAVELEIGVNPPLVCIFVAELDAIFRKEMNGGRGGVEPVRYARLRLKNHRDCLTGPAKCSAIHMLIACKARQGLAELPSTVNSDTGGSYQPITIFDSITFRARSRSVPVSCMYKRIACTLSPAAFDRQSRAT